jgi:hypothetical protein
MPVVLFLGSSGADYDADSPSVIDLMRPELGARSSEAAWELASERLYFSPSMARRAAAQVEAHRPDVVVLFFSSINLVLDNTLSRVGRRRSAVRRAADALMQLLRRLGGGGLRGAPGPRGWLFRGPQWLARRLLGQAPLVRLDDAVDQAGETIDAILTAGAPRLICRLSTMHWERAALVAAAEDRQEALNRAIDERCQARGVTVVDITAAMAREGKRPGVAPDGIHVDLATRRFEAALLADQIVAALAPTTAGR